MSQSVQITEYASGQPFTPSDAPEGPRADGVRVSEVAAGDERIADMEYDGAVPGDNRYQVKTDAGVDAAVDAIAGELGSPKETAAAGDSTILVYEEDGQVDSVAVRPVEGGSVVSLYRDSFSDDTARDVRQAASTAVQSGV